MFVLFVFFLTYRINLAKQAASMRFTFHWFSCVSYRKCWRGCKLSWYKCIYAIFFFYFCV